MRSQVPQLREEDHVEHAAQVADAGRPARSRLEADHPLDRRHVAEAPKPERILEIGQFLTELVQIPMRRGVAIGNEPRRLDTVTGRVGQRPVSLEPVRRDGQTAPSQQPRLELGKLVIAAGGMQLWGC